MERAIELAVGLGDTLVVVYAVEPPFRGVGDEWKESQQALQELGTPIVEQAVTRAGEAGVAAESALVPKRPAEALLEVAIERSPRLIVVGGERAPAHGRHSRLGAAQARPPVEHPRARRARSGSRSIA